MRITSAGFVPHNNALICKDMYDTDTEMPLIYIEI